MIPTSPSVESLPTRRPAPPKPRPKPADAVPADFPRLIWMVWLQGIVDAPETVRACIATWRKQNPGWEVRTLTRRTLPLFIGPAEAARILDQRKDFSGLSDDIRIAVLREHGGVWVDATLYCLKPLDQWLGPQLRSGFFAFRRGAADAINPSFIAAHRGAPAMTAWASAMHARPISASPDGAREWLSRCFAFACRTDAACAAAWLEGGSHAGLIQGADLDAGGMEVAGLLSRRLPFLCLPSPANDAGRMPDLAVKNLTRQALADAPPPF